MADGVYRDRIIQLFSRKGSLMLRPMICMILMTVVSHALAQSDQQPRSLDGSNGRDLLLRLYRPQSMLKVPRHVLKQAKFPVVDVHTHFRRFNGRPDRVDEFVGQMDQHNVAVCTSLDGYVGDQLEEHRKLLWTKHRDRFVIFARVPWRGDGSRDDPATWDCHRPDFGHRVTLALTDAKRQGASGLKISKALGLYLRNPDGSLIKIDDPRWDPIWKACGDLGMPVLIHISDPAAFFHPVDARNERWNELRSHPSWSFHGDDFPDREELLAARNRVIRRHPTTTFIGAHVANDPENLGRVAEWFAEFPNFHAEIGARISDLGRQPYTARRWMIENADRILFGTDGPMSPAQLSIHWRFLETLDEYFPYGNSAFPSQGYWNIYGLGLPDDVLRKIYHENAARIIPGVAERLERFKNRK